jgi:hypothetical protein
MTASDALMQVRGPDYAQGYRDGQRAAERAATSTATSDKTAASTAGAIHCPKCDGRKFTVELRSDDTLAVTCDSVVCGAWSLDLNQWTPDQWDDEWVAAMPEGGEPRG